MNISMRMGLVISASVLVTGLVIALVMNSWFYTSAVEEKRKWAASLTRTIAATIALDTLENKKSKVRTQLLEIQKQNPDIEYAYITDFDGRLFVSTVAIVMDNDSDIGEREAVQHQDVEEYLQHEFMGKMIFDIGYPLIENLPAHLHIGFSKSAIGNFVSEVTEKSMLIILLILLFATMISSYVAGKLSLPIIKLADYVGAYGKGDRITEKLSDIGGGNDEIGQLYHSFVQMIEQRSWYETELHEHRNNLEKLVRQRTDELENVIHAHELTEVSLLEAKDIAEQASRAKTEFMSNMSHELRTPLNAVLGFAQLIKTEDSENKVINMGVEQIMVASNHLLGLINDVLDLSGIEAGNIQVESTTIDLNKMIDECLAMLSVSTKLKLPVINYHAGADKNHVLADKVRLKQVVINLLTNAIKYNKDNNDISVEIKSRSDRLCLYVRDQGVGIPDLFKHQVFLPFNRQEKYVAIIEGSGIGLAISKRLIERMGGSIGFTSVEGEGSEFWICLPRSDVDVPSARIDNLGEAELLMQKLTNRVYTVLYIEDNLASMLLTRKLLEKYTNIEFLTTTEPLVGLDMAREKQPDLIFLDINMPGMNGYEVKESLASNTATRDIPVVAISANAIKEDIEKALQLGFRKYLTKPVDIKLFYQVVYEYLGAASKEDA